MKWESGRGWKGSGRGVKWGVEGGWKGGWNTLYTLYTIYTINNLYTLNNICTIPSYSAPMMTSVGTRHRCNMPIQPFRARAIQFGANRCIVDEPNICLRYNAHIVPP